MPRSGLMLTKVSTLCSLSSGSQGRGAFGLTIDIDEADTCNVVAVSVSRIEGHLA